ncbi:MAG: hypothetical protein CML24_08345 [Rhizobiales bacterium]|nr:hypothetical protein [Hyphomicrobiales bacterium]
MVGDERVDTIAFASPAKAEVHERMPRATGVLGGCWVSCRARDSDGGVGAAWAMILSGARSGFR